MDKNKKIPWVEKYRPICFDNIVLDPLKKKIFQNIITKKMYFPNMIFFGPPGTGKTTTIINIINTFHSHTNTPLIIHLNASDERGIDIIRTHILQFVCSNGLFQDGMKFIILDEIDYMTRTAQLALKCVIEHYANFNVRFCLICNYISKIDASLAQNFIMFRFNTHPFNAVFSFIKNISQKENLNLSDESITHIIHLYKSDLRSMINFIQLNRLSQNYNSLNYKDFSILLSNNLTTKNINKISVFKENAFRSQKKNMDFLKDIISFTFYKLRSRKKLTSEFLTNLSYIYHNVNIDDDSLILIFYEFILPDFIDCASVEY